MKKKIYKEKQRQKIINAIGIKNVVSSRSKKKYLYHAQHTRIKYKQTHKV